MNRVFGVTWISLRVACIILTIVYYLLLDCGLIKSLVHIVSSLKMWTSKGDLNLILKIIPFWSTAINMIIKYYTCQIMLGNIRALFNNIIVDWQMWNSEEEIDIIKKYAKEGRLNTILYAGYVYFLSIAYYSITFVPRLMDVIEPLNESRPLKLPILSEYFIDEEEHFYPLFTLNFCSLLYSATVLIAVDTQLMILTCHVCSVFAIVGYRLEHFLKDAHTIDNWSNHRRKKYIENIVLSINGHKRAIEFANCIESSFSYSLLLQSGFNILCMTISLYQITEEMSDQLAESLPFAGFILAQLFHIFCTCYVGQRIIDHSIHIGEKAYNSMWYEAPTEINKLLLLIMRKSIEPSNLTAGKIFIFCIQSFSSILHTSTSYFMVLSSVQ